ncbi:serine hydrolase [Propionicimonas sp.]|uniref:serine hydrolase domain-containing protein n=1 Tax=Propionicimonas sp. TaxID=1955623 RepID=UPI0017B497E8|nr:serine hydrolase domain-containing protein [Propionicimonas sp.]MBU3978013.1 beta-lactamase family protein [Actinomycetota bacterium]MBA3021765.1 beta-lactamase family protein [Propionicimonas sp.]MBU3985457.1 beta-lactamase family protein [Actinomycetota bacterium]MBU4007552.1 beta-lactamase family protein [Actinomycetota bacterium]MBU4066554.1 beta-lactamase family protein [Actinomycetota bacterium]
MQTTLIVLAVALLTLGAGLVIAPRTIQLGPATTGDAALAEQVRRLVGDPHGYQTLSVTVVTKDTIRHAGLGEMDGRTPTKDTPFELGSITKTFDGLLLADAITRGEVRAEDELATHLPELASSPIGGVTLAELSSHRGGVPPLPPSVMLRAIPGMIANTNPYAMDYPTLMAEVAKLELMKTRGTMAYSNLGATLLGHALAAAAGEPDWRSYVTKRLLTPLGMTHTTFAAVPSQIPEGALVGLSENARRLRPWTSDAFAPAGAATWTTPVDMAAYAQAILTGRAPGLDALTPRWDTGDDTRFGYAWAVVDVDGHQVVGHDGGTNGYRTFLGINRESGEAVLVASNTNRDVTSLAVALLTHASNPISGPGVPIAGLIALGFALVVGAISAWLLARGTDVLGLIEHSSLLLGLVFLARADGPWDQAPGWTWALLAAGAAAAVTIGALRLKPTLIAKGRHWWRWFSTGVAVVFGLGLFAAML